MNLLDTMRADVPEGRAGDMAVWRFTVPPDYPGKFRDAMRGREVPPGRYTGLFQFTGRSYDIGANRRGYKTWMSDTPAELREHLEPLGEVVMRGARRVLINGLGLGCLLKGVLAVPVVEHVDVVEISPAVIKLVGPSFDDPRVNIIQADALDTGLFPANTTWDVAWHDIWPDGNGNYRDQLLHLMRSYGRRTRWQGAWAHDAILEG